MPTTGRRSGRPTETVLTRQSILETGLRLLDAHGTQGAGIRDVARAMGVRPSALYNHISGADDLLAGIRELVAARIDVEVFDTLPWDLALEVWAESYRRAFAAHPPTIALFAVLPLAENSLTGHMWNRVCAALMDAGWPLERVLPVLVTLESFILGSALDSAAPADMMDPGESAGMSALRAAFAARSQDVGGQHPGPIAFTAGLRAMIAGLRLELESSQKPSDSKP